jgi:hypothetical protein
MRDSIRNYGDVVAVDYNMPIKAPLAYLKRFLQRVGISQSGIKNPSSRLALPAICGSLTAFEWLGMISSPSQATEK